MILVRLVLQKEKSAFSLTKLDDMRHSKRRWTPPPGRGEVRLVLQIFQEESNVASHETGTLQD